MAKDLVLEVIARKNSRELSLLADEFDKVANQTDDFGKKLNKTTTFSKYLDDQIVKTKVQVKQLGEEFDRTGKKDVFASLKGAESNLKKLENIRKQLTQSLERDAEKAGIQVGDAFQGGFIGVLGNVVKAAGPILIPAAVVLADELLAAVGAALTAGVGAGGLAVGIVGAFQDPSVKAAGKELGTTLKGTLTEAGQSFVGPVRQAILDLDQAAFKGSDQVAKALEPLARAIGPIEKGIEGFVNSALPGLTKAFRQAEPVLEEVGRQLPGLGRAVGDALEKISHNVGENRAAIAQTFQIIDKTIEGLGTLLSTAEKVFGGIIKVAEPIAHFDKTVFGWVPFMGDQLKHTSDSLDNVNNAMKSANNLQGVATTAASAAATAISKQADAAKSAATDFAALAGVLNKTTENADTLAGAMSDKMLGSLLAGDHAALGFQESLTAVNDSLAQNGTQLDITTAKGQANREAVLSAVEANVRQYDANIASGDSAQEAAGKYDANTEALRRQLKQAGLTKDQIDGLIGKYAQVPDKVNTNIALEGLTNALNNVAILIGAINGIPKYVKIEAAIEAVDNSGLAQNLPNRHRASGGPVTAGQPYIVGEQRPELFVPNVNGTIIPRIPAPMPYAPSSAASGSRTYNINVNAPVGSSPAEVGAQVVEVIRKYEQANGARWRQ